MRKIDYEIVIGLEVHVELKTKTKLGCGCSTKFGAEPNTQVCPVCLGMPGSLPLLNKKAVELAIITALGLNCTIADQCRFDRKQYFYPDLPKGYQITQFYQPMGRDGWLEIDDGDRQRRITITRIHLEEEAGRTYHSSGKPKASYSLLDYNRSGIPLLEIVTAPELHSPQEARRFLEELKGLLEYLEVSDGKMEEGSFRCDANLSLHRPGDKLGKRVELKNLNSFRAMEAALDFEVQRQRELLVKGQPLTREEARTWVEEQRSTVFMRFKEEAAEYRYFPDPELPLLTIDQRWVESLRLGLPELPAEKRNRFRRVYGLSAVEALLLCRSKAEAAFFEAVLRSYQGEARQVSNWVLGELTRLMKETKIDFSNLKFSPEDLADLLSLIDQKVISGKSAKAVLTTVFTTGKKPAAVIREKGLSQINDPEAIKTLVNQTLAAHPQVVQEYHAGKEKVIGFLVGSVMGRSRGRVNPELVNRILVEELEKNRS